MGLLDRFRKEEHTSFERDSSGKVTNVYRNGREGKTTDQLIMEYNEKHPSRFKSWTQTVKRERQERRYEQQFQRQRERDAYQKGLQAGRLKRAETMGFQRGYGIQRMTPLMQPPRPRRKKTSPQRRSRQQPRRSNRPLQFDFMTGRWY